MKRVLLTLLAVLLLATPVVAQTVVPVPPPIVLPAPPPGSGEAHSLLFNAMLSIARAQAANPQAAQNAAFAYTKAIQQYQIGDRAGARASAREAIAQSNATPQAPFAIPTIAPYAAPSASLPSPLFGLNGPQIDASAFLALTRGQLASCNAAVAPQAQKDYARAQDDYAAQKYEAVRLDARAAIDLCARAK